MKESEFETTPTEKDIDVVLHGLVDHLQDKHDKCFPEVCWLNNDDLTIQDPHLMDASKEEVAEFSLMIATVYKRHQSQKLITATRTTSNEAFNNSKLTV